MQRLVVIFPMLLATALAGHLIPLAYYQTLPQYSHAQNTKTGEYAYSYAGGPSSKAETKSVDGVTRGAYSYIDANGLLQNVNYVADDNGFHVAGSSDVPAVAVPAVSAVPVLTHVYHELPLAKVSLHHVPVAHIATSPTVLSSSSQTTIHARKKRAAVLPLAYSAAYPYYDTVKIPATLHAVHHVEPVLPVVSAVSSSHQSQVQIHRSAAKLEPVLPLVSTYAAIPTVPLATSSQSQQQHHHAEVKTTLHQPIVAAAVPAVVPTATSSQTRHQIHKSGAVLYQPVISLHHPIYAAYHPLYAPAHALSLVSAQQTTSSGGFLQPEAPKLQESQPQGAKDKESKDDGKADGVQVESA